MKRVQAKKDTQMTKLISFKQLREKLGGRSRSACYLDLKAGRIPRPLKIGRILYWDEERLDEHLINLQNNHEE